jgi:hypothetical protein
MPNKYSHSVVLYQYARAGLIEPHESFLAERPPQRGRATSSAHPLYRTTSSRQSNYSQQSIYSSSESLDSPRSQIVKTPTSFSGRKPAIRIQPSTESLQQLDEPEEKPIRPNLTQSNSTESTIILPPVSPPPPKEPSLFLQEDMRRDAHHKDCSDMTCAVNCFQPSLGHVKSDIVEPNMPRESTRSSTPLTGPRSIVPTQARGGLRSVTTASHPPQTPTNNRSPAAHSTATAAVNRTQPQRRPQPPQRPDSTSTQIFDPLPTETDYLDFSSPSSPATQTQPTARERRLSLESLSSLSSFSSVNTDAPTLTTKSPAQQHNRYPSNTTERHRYSCSFWDNVASCGDTLALCFPPTLSTSTSVSDLSSYPPDIPTRRRIYPTGTSRSQHGLRNQRATLLMSPPTIPLYAQRESQAEVGGKRNWFGVGNVLKKKTNDGTVRNSAGIVIGARP